MVEARFAQPSSAIGLSSRPQWLGRHLGRVWQRQKVADIDRQGCRKAIKNIDRRIELLLLDAADVAAVNIGIDGKHFLTHALCRANSPKIPSDAGASVHGPQAINLLLVKPSNIFDIKDKSRLGPQPTSKTAVDYAPRNWRI